jgi:hypothetical protein
MKIFSTIAMSALAAVIAATFAFAQAPAPAPAAPKATTVEKQAVSKACSQQADAKGLHGKARKKFRSACRRTGGKT